MCAKISSKTEVKSSHSTHHTAFCTSLAFDKRQQVHPPFCIAWVGWMLVSKQLSSLSSDHNTNSNFKYKCIKQRGAPAVRDVAGGRESEARAKPRSNDPPQKQGGVTVGLPQCQVQRPRVPDQWGVGQIGSEGTHPPSNSKRRFFMACFVVFT